MTPPAPADAGRRAHEFAAVLSTRADDTGFIRFDRFMEAALYDPGLGYYSDPGRTLGRSGDFYTATHVAPTFAWALGARIRAEWERLGRPNPWRIVEIGPGDGTLAVDLVRYLETHLPPDANWELELSDRSAGWEERSRERARAVATDRVRIVESGRPEPFVGAVLGNEVLDACPSRRFGFTGSLWEEYGIRLDADSIITAYRPVEHLPDGVIEPEAPEEGTVVESAPAWNALLRSIADRLEEGCVLLLDYGLATPRERPHGTLAAVREHRSQADPLDHPGEADLSVFVNFEAIRGLALRAGLREVAFRRQRDALGAWGYESIAREWLDAADETTERVRRQLASKKLLFGFENFYALELEAGLARPPPSTGSS